jgi:hypothetical protein
MGQLFHRKNKFLTLFLFCPVSSLQPIPLFCHNIHFSLKCVSNSSTHFIPIPVDSNKHVPSIPYMTLLSSLTVNSSSPWRDSSVGIATRYGLDGPGIEYRKGRDFPHPSRRALGPPSLLHNGYRVLPGINAAGAWRWPPTPSSAEVKERVELYLYSSSGTSWPVLGWPLPLPFTSISTRPHRF